MENKRLDCTNLDCPMPVIKAKQFLEENENIVLDVIVDNNVAVQNLEKLAKSLSLKSKSSKDGNNFVVSIEKKETIQNDENKMIVTQENQTILIRTNILGYGNDDLGATLMKGFIFTLTQSKPFPKKVMFLNSGVKLTSENEETIKNLKVLEENGVEIVSCGACLDFYNLKESVKVGSIGNMYDIVDSLNKSTNKLTI
jgi:selenium metabolism protein yedF